MFNKIMENTHANTESMAMNNFLSCICFSLASISETLSNISGEEIYNFCFRFLSIISLSFVIIINWPKVKEVVISSYKKHKNGRNKKR